MSDRSEEAKIRKEWLQFRGALYDYHVDFPTLPIVMDKVRKNIGNFKKIGLIYLDIIESVETIHGWQKFEEVLKRISIIWESSE